MAEPEDKDAASCLFPVLPHEMMEEILIRVQVKSLMRFRCVCKSWSSLVSDPGFALRHAEALTIRAKDIFSGNSCDNNGSCLRRFGVITTSQCRLKSCRLNSLYNKPYAEFFEHDQELFGRDYYQVIGTCNGLICFHTHHSNLCLWNPTVKTHTKLPDLDIGNRFNGYITYGFGYDRRDRDYKVLALSRQKNDNETLAKVYSTSGRSWKNIGFPARGIAVEKSRPGIYINGTLNWAATDSLSSSSHFFILSYDLSNQTFKKLPQVVCPNSCFVLTLGELGGCLSMVCYCRRGKMGFEADVWVMKEFGNGESWNKLVSISGVTEYFRPLWISNGCEMLLEFRSGLVMYDCKNGFFRYPVVKGISSCRNTTIFVESLVSPNDL